MKKALFWLFFSLTVAGCGSGADSTAVTPVMGNNRGTYRLAATTVTLTAPGGASASYQSYSTGTLRLFDDATFTRTTSGGSNDTATSGSFLFAGSTSSILGSRQGSFAIAPLGTPTPTFTVVGAYDVTPDYTLAITYSPYALPDQTTVSRVNVWIKESDSPTH